MTITQLIRQRLQTAHRGSFMVTSGETTDLDLAIDALFQSIISSDNVDMAKASLDDLGELQEVLATMLFKHNVPLSGKQRWVVRNFDRSDDSDARRYVFQAIKDGKVPSDGN